MNAGQLMQDTEIRRGLNALHSATILTQEAVVELLEQPLIESANWRTQKSKLKDSINILNQLYKRLP